MKELENSRTCVIVVLILELFGAHIQKKHENNFIALRLCSYALL